MINKFNLDTVANPENMNMLIEGINKNEEDISGLKTSVEGVSSQIGQLSNKSFIPRGDLSIALVTKDLNQAMTEGGYLCVETETIRYINKPPLIGWFTLLIYLGGTGAVFQEAIQQYDGTRVSRHYNGANWSSWKEVATTDKVIPYNPTPQPNLDANNILTTSIITTASYCTNLPTPVNLPASTEGVLTTNKYNAQFIMQTFRPIYPEQPTFTRTLYQGVWQPWGIQKQEIPFPFLSGFTNYSSAVSYIINTINSKKISVCINCSGTFAAGVITKIGVIPVGIRPKTVVTNYIRGYTGSTPIIQGIIETDSSGNVYVTCTSAAIACFGTVEWDY